MKKIFIISLALMLAFSFRAEAQFGPNAKLDFSGTPTIMSTGTNPITIGTAGSGSLRLRTNDTDRVVIDSTGQTTYGSLSNGQAIRLKSASQLLSGMSGATVSTTSLVPAGAIVLGCTIRVTTLITASAGTGFTIGDGTTADRWGSAVALAAGTTTTGADFKASTTLLQAYPSGMDVTLTMTGGNFTAGATRVTCHYMDFVAATS